MENTPAVTDDTEVRIGLVWKNIREKYRQLHLSNTEPVERKFVEILGPPLCHALHMPLSDPGQAETPDQLQKLLLPIPLAVFPVVLIYNYGMQPGDSPTAACLYDIVRTAELHTRGRGKFLVILSSCRHELILVHNWAEMNVTGEKFPLGTANEDVVCMDTLPMFLRALSRANRGINSFDPKTALYVTAVPDPKWATMSERVLNVTRDMTKVAWQLYFTLCLHTTPTRRTVRISERDLAHQGHMFQTAIPRALDRLVTLGLVEVQPRQNGEIATYFLPLGSGGIGSHIMVPELLLYLPSALEKRQWAVYVAMIAHMSIDMGFAFVTRRDLAPSSETRFFRLSKTIQDLEQYGLILPTKYKAGSNRMYCVLGRMW